MPQCHGREGEGRAAHGLARGASQRRGHRAGAGAGQPGEKFAHRGDSLHERGSEDAAQDPAPGVGSGGPHGVGEGGCCLAGGGGGQGRAGEGGLRCQKAQARALGLGAGASRGESAGGDRHPLAGGRRGPFHPRPVGGKEAPACRAGGKGRAVAARAFRPDRTAAEAGGGRGFPRRYRPAGFRQGRGRPARVAAFRRALGASLARLRALRRDARARVRSQHSVR